MGPLSSPIRLLGDSCLRQAEWLLVFGIGVPFLFLHRLSHVQVVRASNPAGS